MTLAELQHKYDTSIGLFQPNPECKHCHGDGERTIRTGANSGQTTICVCLYVSHDQSDAVGDMLNGEVMVIRKIEPEQEIQSAEIDAPVEVEVGMTGFEADIEWAYRNLGKHLIEEHAPSGGAWYFHELSKEDRKQFISLYKGIVEQRAKKSEGQEGMRDDQRTRIGVIDTILREYDTSDIANLRVALVRNPEACKPIVELWLKDQKRFRDEFMKKSARKGELKF